MMDNRKTKEKSTRIQCIECEWDGIKDCFTGYDADNRNRQIEQIRRILNENKLIKEVLNESVSADELIEMTTVNQRYRMKFTEVLQLYINEQALKIRTDIGIKSQANIEESTWLSYGKRQKNIIEFLTHAKKINMMAMDWDVRMCELLDNYLTQTGRGQGYATKHVKLVKTVMRFAASSKIITVNFADNYKTKSEPKRKVTTLKYSDYDKLNEVAHLLSSTEQKYIDVLIFMRETFLHVGDYLELTSAHIKKYDNGQMWLIKPRKKRIEENNQIQVVPLSKIAIDLIEKYGSVEAMPKTTQVNINRYIKIAAAKAGIEINVSSKMARSSGISHKYNFGKMREHSIAAVAGWTTTRELSSYLEIDTEQLRTEFLQE